MSEEGKATRGRIALRQWSSRVVHFYRQYQLHLKSPQGQIEVPLINGFGNCWSSGIAFVCIFHRYRMLNSFSFTQLSKMPTDDLLTLALETCKSNGLDAFKFITVDDIKNGDEEKILRLVLGIYQITEARRDKQHIKDKAELCKEIDLLNDQIDRLKFEAQFANEQLMESEDETKYMKRQLQTERQMRQSLEKRNSYASQEEMAQKLKDLQFRLEQEINEKVEIKKRLMEEMQKNTELQIKVIEYEKQIALGTGYLIRAVPSPTSTLEMEELKKENKKLEEEIAAQTQKQNSEIEELKKTVATQQTENERLQRLLMMTRKSSTDLKLQLSKNMEKVQTLESEKKRLSRTKSDISSLDYAKINEKLEVSTKQKQKLEVQLQELKESYDNLLIESEKKSRDIATLESKVKRITSKYEKSEKEREILENSIKGKSAIPR